MTVAPTAGPYRSRRLVVGSRTTHERDARGRGITLWDVDQDGAARLIEVVDVVNPSYLIHDPRHSMLHTVHGDRSAVSSFLVTADGRLEQRSMHDTGGRNPAHLTLSRNGGWLLVANHGSGSVAVLSVLSDGTLGPRSDLLDWMDGPHQVVVDPGSDTVLVPDKRADAIHVLHLDTAIGTLRQVGTVECPEGAGPRHLVIDHDAAAVHCLDELSSTVSTYTWSALAARSGKMPLGARVGRVSTLRDTDDPAQWRAAELLIDRSDGRVYASNRSGAGDHTSGGPGDDHIAVLEPDDRSGSLHLATHLSSRGIRPRHFTTAPSDLMAGRSGLTVANERSDRVVHLVRDGAQWREWGQAIETGSPTCALWI